MLGGDWKSYIYITLPSFMPFVFTHNATRCIWLDLLRSVVCLCVYFIDLRVKMPLHGRVLLLVPTVENRWWRSALAQDSCSCAAASLDAAGASAHDCGAETWAVWATSRWSKQVRGDSRRGHCKPLKTRRLRMLRPASLHSAQTSLFDLFDRFNPSKHVNRCAT